MPHIASYLKYDTMAESARPRTDVQAARVLFPSRPTTCVEKVALFSNTVSGDTRCACISGPENELDTFSKGGYFANSE